MSVTIKYKGNTIASANTDTTKTLQTSGKYCEGDIVVENVQDGGITPSGSITLTEERSYDVTEKATAIVDMSATRANLAEAVTAKGVDTLPTSSFDTIATNIGLISGGGGLPSSITKIDGGCFTFANDEAIQSNKISHTLGAVPKGFAIWSEEVATDRGVHTTQRLAFALAIGIEWNKASGSNSFGYNYNMWKKTDNNVAETTTNQMTMTITQIAPAGYFYWQGGATYKWIAWA